MHKPPFRLSVGDSLTALVIAVSLFVMNSSSHAQQRFVRSQATESSKEDALAKAKLGAWRNYLSSIQGAKLDNILANEKSFIDNLDKYLGAITIVDEKCEGIFGKCTVSIKATVNESLVDADLRQNSKNNKNGSGGKNDGNDDIAFLVMARVLDEGTRFQTRVTNRTESTVSTTGSTSSSDSSQTGRVSSNDSQQDVASVTQSAKTVKGGSELVKRDKNIYVAWGNVNDLQNSIQETLNNNKIQPLDWASLIDDCGLPDNRTFSKQYAESETGELPVNVRREVFGRLQRECKSGPVPRIIVAQIEIDGYRTDPGTGLWLATGNINLNVYDLARRGRSISSANRTFSGRAETKLDASRNALAVSAKVAADVVVNILNSK